MTDKLPVKHIIDVREPYEFQSGHVNGAVNVPLGQIQHANSKLIETIDKDSQIVLYCRTGNRSSQALEILNRQGFKNLINGIDADSTNSKYYLQTNG